MKQNIYHYALILVILLAGSWYVEKELYSWQGNRIAEVVVGGHAFRVEVVQDEIKLARGLGGRKGLCRECGMLFLFGQKGHHAFWMKDMRFPLDIFWISDGRVVGLRKNVTPAQQEALRPEIEAQAVLELNAGSADSYGIKEGSGVAWR